MLNEKRLAKVLFSMKKDNIYQFLITDPKSIYYLTNIYISPGERFLGLYINQDNNIFLINNYLFPLNNDETKGIEIIYYDDTQKAVDKLSNIVKKSKTIAVDKHMYAHFLIEMTELNLSNKYINGSPYVDYVRIEKDEEEQRLMIEASQINDKAMELIINEIKYGLSELTLVECLKSIYKQCGANGGFSFSPIIAFGNNAANPHHSSNNTIIKGNGSIIIDMGCKHNGYCSDMTRTVFMGKADDNKRKIYNIVKEANEIAISGVKPGIEFSHIDFLARNHIEKNGYGKYFTHRTGHSIGMDVHEYGDVSKTHHAILKEGMIFSIEPGIYIKNEVGVRIEDLILVTSNGYKNLNSFTKELIEIAP